MIILQKTLGSNDLMFELSITGLLMPDNLNIHTYSCPAMCEVGAHPTAEATIEVAELLS